MNVYTIVALCVVVCVAILLLKNQNPSIGFILSVSFSVVILILCFPKLNSIFHTLSNISEKAGIETSLFKILIKKNKVIYN